MVGTFNQGSLLGSIVGTMLLNKEANKVRTSIFVLTIKNAVHNHIHVKIKVKKKNKVAFVILLVVDV